MKSSWKGLSRSISVGAVLGLITLGFSVIGTTPASAVGSACFDQNGIGQYPTQSWTSGDDSIGGSTGDDVLQGGLGNDTIYADLGNDLICGDAVQANSGGNDTIHGDQGNDVVISDYGNDTIDGGGGNDTYVVNVLTSDATGGQAATVDLSASQGSCATGYTEVANDGFGSTDCIKGFENVTTLSKYNDTLTGNSAINVIRSNADTNDPPYDSGADTLNGLGGGDTLNSAEGTDTSVDTLDGGTGTDTCVKDSSDTQTNCEA